MISKNFSKNCLHVRISQGEKGVHLNIESDYSHSPRKSQLHVDSKKLEKEVEDFWKSIKTKMLLHMVVAFNEIDWYDDHTDIYVTPVVSIQRGLKKAKTRYNEHGSIPKEWSFGVLFTFKSTKVITPILEVLEMALGNLISKKELEEFTKVARPVLQKVKTYEYFNLHKSE